MNKDAKIYVAGHTGLVGSAIMRKLEAEGYKFVVRARSAELDLRNQQQVDAFFEREKPEYVFLAAAKVGGIMANSTYSAEFIYDNMMIATNVIHASYKHGVKKLLNLGSSCIYPKNAPQPLKEEYLLTGPLESTNEPYAIAKIAAIKLCESYNRQYGTNFISAMPTNLYGPGDNFDLETAHVLPAMIRKFHEAKINNNPKVTLWGTGTPRREFLYSDDLADALLFLMHNFNASGEGDYVNVGTGEDIAIKDLAALVQKIVGYNGEIEWDASKPDGTPRKLLDVNRLYQSGWSCFIRLPEGIQSTYNFFTTMLRDK
ncbi:MAG: GDP-L-fucose synthase [Calditrichaeota bacterium]|nr:MAG: GDP-L-fucose synthase [Calditrichota bacterium]